MRSTIHTESAPAAIGPYSQAIAAGNLVFCSGQIPLDPVTMEMKNGSVEEETRQVLVNMGEVLSAAGCDFADVVRTTVFLTDMGDFATVNEIYSERFGDSRPARACVQVAGLPKGARVEIDCIALKP
ncbi:MAG: reactive intermediate/imine deaminase [Planctomycetota bacterium]|nr:MAG: reactive intermediate/imine deaminase [Planctomycetota bacterium]